jgi:hypothetical protein
MNDFSNVQFFVSHNPTGWSDVMATHMASSSMLPEMNPKFSFEIKIQ